MLAALLTFVYEGSCKVEAGLLTEMLDAAARLVVDPHSRNKNFHPPTRDEAGRLTR